MAKMLAKIGFAEQVETAPGVWEEQFTERLYYGDLIKNTRRLQSTDGVNDNITISNEVSIIADPYANQNFHTIRYVEFMGTKWKISMVDVQYPRLIMSVGGVCNV